MCLAQNISVYLAVVVVLVPLHLLSNTTRKHFSLMVKHQTSTQNSVLLSSHSCYTLAYYHWPSLLLVQPTCKSEVVSRGKQSEQSNWLKWTTLYCQSDWQLSHYNYNNNTVVSTQPNVVVRQLARKSSRAYSHYVHLLVRHRPSGWPFYGLTQGTDSKLKFIPRSMDWRIR